MSSTATKTLMALFIAGVVRHINIGIQARSRKQRPTLELDIEVGMARGLHQQVGCGSEQIIVHDTSTRTGNEHISQRQMCL